MRASVARAAFACLAWSALGCAHLGEAFDERIAQNLDDGFRRVSLRCELPLGAPRAPGAALALAAPTGPGDQRPLLTPFAVVPKSASGELVGEVFGQGTGQTRWSAPFPLGLEGRPLADQLAAAVRERLARGGFAVAGDAAPVPRLALTLQRVWVHSYPGSFFELRGHLVAHVEWTAVLLAPEGGRTLWSRTFSRHAARRIAYAYARDHEGLLRDAWCASLADFATRLDTEIAPLIRPAP